MQTSYRISISILPIIYRALTFEPDMDSEIDFEEEKNLHLIIILTIDEGNLPFIIDSK